MEPTIITKKFILAGFEDRIDVKESHWPGMDTVKSLLKLNLDKIENKILPVRFVGLWMIDPSVDYSKPENHSKRMYFYSVEVSNTDVIPAGCIIKNVPESIYAVFREHEHGTAPMYKWLETSEYDRNMGIVPAYMLDMEIFDTVDGVGDEWDVLVPISEKA
jgi:predicted transcriptional regulator YdeE